MLKPLETPKYKNKYIKHAIDDKMNQKYVVQKDPELKQVPNFIKLNQNSKDKYTALDFWKNRKTSYDILKHSK